MMSTSVGRYFTSAQFSRTSSSPTWLPVALSMTRRRSWLVRKYSPCAWEALARRVHLVAAWLRTISAELALEVGVTDGHGDLERGVGVVAQHEVDVVEDDAHSGAPRQDASLVGEGIERVLRPLHHGEVAVQREPVDEVAELAEPAADA